MRCFIAIDFPDVIKEKIAEIQTELKKSGADIRWVDPRHMHLTLYFFKELSPEKAALLSEKINEEVQKIESFELTLEGLGAFPSIGDPRVIWIGIQNSQKVTALYRKILEMARPFDEENHKKEEKEIDTPHATIGRVRSRKNIHRIKEMIKIFSPDPVAICPVRNLIFFESRLSQKGPDYFEIDRFLLGT